MQQIGWCLHRSCRVGSDWLMFKSIIQPKHRLAGDGCIVMVTTMFGRCRYNFSVENQDSEPFFFQLRNRQRYISSRERSTSGSGPWRPSRHCRGCFLLPHPRRPADLPDLHRRRKRLPSRRSAPPHASSHPWCHPAVPGVQQAQPILVSSYSFSTVRFLTSVIIKCV